MALEGGEGHEGVVDAELSVFAAAEGAVEHTHHVESGLVGGAEGGEGGAVTFGDEVVGVGGVFFDLGEEARGDVELGGEGFGTLVAGGDVEDFAARREEEALHVLMADAGGAHSRLFVRRVFAGGAGGGRAGGVDDGGDEVGGEGLLNGVG